MFKLNFRLPFPTFKFKFVHFSKYPRRTLTFKIANTAHAGSTNEGLGEEEVLKKAPTTTRAQAH